MKHLRKLVPAYGLSDLISSTWNAVSKVRFLLVSNRILSERVDGRTEDSLDEKPITYSVWDLKRIHSLAVAGSSREDLVVDLKNDFGGTIPILPARQSDDDLESYLAAVPGEVLANIYDRWGARLLEQNVRVFLQSRGKVNKAIRKTLEYEPNMFFAFNNGITATAEALEIQDDGDHMRLCSLKNFQIVNGGQTTASIHVAKLNGVDISKTFVQMKLSIVDSERATALVPKISEYANSQNRVTAADFFSNHPFHVRIEEFSRRLFAPSPEGSFRQSKWFYERARGQYADARARLSRSQRKKFDLEFPRKQLLTKTDLAKHWNVWECRPHEVSLGAQKNFAAFARRIDQAWEKSPDDFNEFWFREAVAKSIVFKATERIVSAQSWYQGGYRANIVAYAIAKIAYDINRNDMALDFTTIWRLQTITSSMMKSVEVVAREIHEVLTNPPNWTSNVTEWAKKEQCWTKARNRNIKWLKELDDELISKEEQTEIREDGKKGQRILNGIEAQIAVVNAGAQFWADALAWGKSRNLLTPTEVGILEVATRNTYSNSYRKTIG